MPHPSVIACSIPVGDGVGPGGACPGADGSPAIPGRALGVAPRGGGLLISCVLPEVRRDLSREPSWGRLAARGLLTLCDSASADATGVSPDKGGVRSVVAATIGFDLPPENWTV